MSTEIMPGTETNRVAWADILKGLGILAVVWGHAGSKTSFYMFWFHMPLFFFISGYLYRFRPHQTWYSYVRKKARHLLVPYLFYLVLITLVMIGVTIWKEQSVAQFFAENWQALILGGSLLAGVYATFWFVTCLFFVQIAFDYLNRKVSSGLLKACVIVGCLLLSYWESRYHQKVFIPWNLDVGLYAIFFYALGYLLKNKGVLEKSNFRNIAFGISLALALGFLYLYTHHILDYGLDMKHRQYYYFGSNILLPLAFTLIILQLSMALAKSKLLSNPLLGLGKAAMVVMYLHLLSADVARHFIAMTPLRFLVIGILGPVLFYLFVKSFPMGRFLALGETMSGTGRAAPDPINREISM
jgi:fucose 4-O-acetylase-like acetyltransferase